MSDRGPFELVAALQAQGLRLGLRGKRVIVTGLRSKLTPELLAELREAHQAQLRSLARVHEAGGLVSVSSTLPDLERRTRPTTAIF